jgi:hypothetical protein
MAWKEWNPNPTSRRVGDCAVRAVARALGVDWETAYLKIAAAGYGMGDMPSSDSVWGAVLRQNGFYRKAVPNTCPMCYTVEMFAQEHPEGIYVLALGGHVVTVEDGDWYDTWNSGDEVPQFYWYREE